MFKKFQLVLLAAILMAATPAFAFGQEIHLLRDFEVEIVDRGRATAPATTGEVQHFSFVAGYTPYLADTYGESAVRNAIETVTAATNAVHEDSGTLLRFPLSGMERTPYVETGDLGIDFQWYKSVRPCDGTVRVLFVGKGVAGGVAGSPGPGENWEPCYAPTSVINLSPLLENKTTTFTYGRLLAHEIGHGFALAHQCTPDQPFCGVCYSNGTGSVMTNGCGPKVGNFRPEVVEHLNAGVPYFSSMLATVDAPSLTCGTGVCVNNGQTICMLDRFAVHVGFDPPNDEEEFPGTYDIAKGKLDEGLGVFTFFDPKNPEVVIKMVDACGPFNRFWVFLGGLTNVEAEVQVCDTKKGVLWTHTNPQNTPFDAVQDTDAFATCDPDPDS